MLAPRSEVLLRNFKPQRHVRLISTQERISPMSPKGEASIVYHAGGKLYLYDLADGSTKQVSTDNKADYRYPHGEATPN
jgi:hypothetical protein